MTGYLDGLTDVPSEYSRNVLDRLDADSLTLLASDIPEHGLSCREEAEQLLGVKQRLELALAARVGRVKTTRAYQDGDRTYGSSHAWLKSGAKMSATDATRCHQTGEQMVAESVSQIWSDAADGKAPLAAAQLSSNAILKLDKKLREQANDAREYAKGRILAGLDPIQDPTDPHAFMCIETEEEADKRISSDIEVYAAIMAALDRQAESLRQIRQAIAVLNAKYDPDGALDAWESTQDKRHLTLWVQDDGCGAGKFVLPPEAVAKLKVLFDKYARKAGPDDLRSKEQRQADVLIGLLNGAVATELLVIVDSTTLLDDPNIPCDCPDHQPRKGNTGEQPAEPEPAPTLFDEADSDSDSDSDNADEDKTADEPAGDESNTDSTNSDSDAYSGADADDSGANANADSDSSAMPDVDGDSTCDDIDDPDDDTDGGNGGVDGDGDGMFGFNTSGRWRGRTQDADLEPDGTPPGGGRDPRLHDLGCIDSMSTKIRDVLERLRGYDPDRDDPTILDRPCDQPPPGPTDPNSPPGQPDPQDPNQPRDPDRPHGPWDHPGGRVYPVAAGERCACCGRAPLNIDFRNAPALIVSTGALVPAPIVRRWAYNSTMYRLVLQGGSVPVNSSTATRYIPDHADRAMKAIYEHCAYDSCVMPIEWTERDHIYEFEHYGRTHPAELAPGCSWHNGDRGAHPEKYIREKLPDGRWHLTTDPNWAMGRKKKKRNW